jgi:hypothetical protein
MREVCHGDVQLLRKIKIANHRSMRPKQLISTRTIDGLILDIRSECVVGPIQPIAKLEREIGLQLSDRLPRERGALKIRWLKLCQNL